MFLSFQEEDRPFTWSSDLHGLTIICFSLVLQVECFVARILTKPIFPSLLSCFSFIHAHMNGGPSRTCVASHFPLPQYSLYIFPANPVACPLFLLLSFLLTSQLTFFCPASSIFPLPSPGYLCTGNLWPSYVMPAARPGPVVQS